jgi:hypothetical protein
MSRLQICLLTVAVVLISAINAQPDPSVCPGGVPSIGVPDPRWHPIPHRFEIMTELVTGGNEISEVSQAFSPKRDAVVGTGYNANFQAYWNFDTNEQFGILNAVIDNVVVPECARTVITPDSQTSVLQPNSLYLKPSILLGFGPRNEVNANWAPVYDGEHHLRGIHVLRFTACFFVNDIRATVNVTYDVSDPERFFSYAAPNETLVLRMEVLIKSQAGRTETYRYNVFHFTHNPRPREERQALETPQGVYCPGRTEGKPVPANIPDRVSANAETFVREANASIISTHNLYDTEFQFTRSDVWYPDRNGGSAWQHRTEIHDFATGLSYRYNHTSRQCRVRDIRQGFDGVAPDEEHPDLIQINDPQHFFLMDDIQYQYTGEKRCRDRVWCDVWIGEKQMPNFTVQHREWYWAKSINGQPLPQLIPAKLVLKTIYRAVPIHVYELNMFNYRRNPFTIFEIDYTLSECYRALGPSANWNIGVLSFKIANDKNYTVFENFNYLRLHIFETLIFALFVRPVRIANLFVDQDATDIIVTFTLLDAPPRTGPVEEPLKESSLDTLIERLNSIIDANGLAFRTKAGARQHVLRARPKSLNVNHRSTENKSKTTGPRITGLWIGFIIAGIVIGAIIAFFAFQKFAK